MGLVTPLGDGVDTNWRRLIAAESGISAIQAFDTSDLATKIAGQVPRGDKANGHFNADAYIAPKDQRKIDEFILFAMAAADQAVEDSGWKPQDEEDRDRTGVMIGSGIGGLSTIDETSLILKERGPRRVSPFFIPSALINLASGQVSIQYGFKGPNHAVVTACATGAHAIGDAARLIMLDDADVMVAGGAEAAICRIGIAGFIACRRCRPASTTRRPQASRPWDKDRDGFVMGEGAGVVVLEEYEHAKKRGAKIYAEVIGYGLSGDAYHITAPAEDGDGGFRAMKAALKRAGLGTDQIDYINAHGTSTMADEIELGAVKRTVRRATPTSSRCPRPSRRSAICSARPARSRRSSRSWRCATRWCRRPSTSTIRTRAATSTWCPSRPSSARCATRSATPSASAAPTPRLIFGPV